MQKSIENVRYFGQTLTKTADDNIAIELIGLDTEADVTGRCFLVCTSLGDVWKMEDVPGCFFDRAHRGKKYAVWNLKYDEGAILQFLPSDNLTELWETGKTDWNGYGISSIPRKLLTIRRGKNSVHIYDLYQFFASSLDTAAKKYLGVGKLEIETKRFTGAYIEKNWNTIVEYCIRDAELVEQLSVVLMGTFAKFQLYPKKLYSTAYVSYQHFKKTCNYVTVKRFWDHDRKVLDFAMRAYRGGKFEVTRKGIDQYYEYDIVSAYPAEIAKLVDITWARIVWSRTYRPYAVYALLHIRAKLPVSLHSPLALQRNGVNTYPVGYVETYCTKQEYDYLIDHDADVTIIEAVWLHVDKKIYPYKAEIDRLVRLKQQYKTADTELEYHTVKILLNSLYGKFVQLIATKDYYKATTCWNPIYGGLITANTRIKISRYQDKYPQVVAVHTDSVITTVPIPCDTEKTLGNLIYETEGHGLVLGSGIYQIGDKVRLRGFPANCSLFDFLTSKTRYVSLDVTHANTWREVVFHDWDVHVINRFDTQKKRIRVDFDSKRIWLDDWTRWSDVEKRVVESMPLFRTPSGI